MSDTKTIYAPSRPVEADRRPVEPPRPRDVRDEPKWAPWKVSTFVILFCAGFWVLAYQLVKPLFG